MTFDDSVACGTKQGCTPIHAGNAVLVVLMLQTVAIDTNGAGDTFATACVTALLD